jgi:Zn-dependent protease
MTMPLVEGGRAIARFRVLGFPVTIDISFVVVVAILGWYPGVQARDMVIWFVVVPVAILVHELGHAVVARTTGAQPVITLAALGGLTSFLPPRPISRARSIAISVAGPAVGIVIGGVLLAYAWTVGVESELWSSVLETTIFTTLGWSVLNLLPILPLDGGQTLRELLPGSPAKREVRAATVSIVFAVLAAVVAFRFGLVFAALLCAFFVVSNVMLVRGAREEAKVDVNQRVVQLLWMDRVDEARALAAEHDELHPLVRAAVRAAGPDGGDARADPETAAVGPPADPTATSLLVVLHRLRGDWSAVRDLVARAPVMYSGDVIAAQTIAFRHDAFRESAEIGEAWLARNAGSRLGEPRDSALIAYNTACGWARAGELDRGLTAFKRAAELGFDDLTAVDSDDDIAPLRPLPGYDEAHQVIRRRALARAESLSDHPPAGPPA